MSKFKIMKLCQPQSKTSVAAKLGFLSIALSIALSAMAEPDKRKEVVILYDSPLGAINLKEPDLSSPYQRSLHILGNILPEKYGFNIKLEPIMWNRGLELIKVGFADAIVDVSYKPDRAEYMVYPQINGQLDASRSLRNSNYLLFHHVDSPIKWDGKTLSNIDGGIGSIQSYAIVDDLRKKGIKVVEMKQPLGLFKDVYIGKLAAALPESSGRAAMASLPYLEQKVTVHPIPLSSKVYYITFSKQFYRNHKALAEKLWAAYKDYKLSDEYQRLNASNE